MRVLQDLTTEEILRWVEWKDVDMQYDLFNKNKFRDDPCSHVGEGWSAEEAFGVSLLCFLLNPDDTKSVLIRAINTNGDSDTIGCISGAIAGAKNGYKSLSKNWIERLEYKEQLLSLADFMIYDQ